MTFLHCGDFYGWMEVSSIVTSSQPEKRLGTTGFVDKLYTLLVAFIQKYALFCGKERRVVVLVKPKAT